MFLSIPFSHHMALKNLRDKVERINSRLEQLSGRGQFFSYVRLIALSAERRNISRREVTLNAPPNGLDPSCFRGSSLFGATSNSTGISAIDKDIYELQHPSSHNEYDSDSYSNDDKGFDSHIPAATRLGGKIQLCPMVLDWNYEPRQSGDIRECHESIRRGPLSGQAEVFGGRERQIRAVHIHRKRFRCRSNESLSLRLSTGWAV